MKKIGYSGTYGDIWDSPGGSGGGAMICLEGIGWVKNPNYYVAPLDIPPVQKVVAVEVLRSEQYR